jgi:hypothetical protein
MISGAPAPASPVAASRSCLPQSAKAECPRLDQSVAAARRLSASQNLADTTLRKSPPHGRRSGFQHRHNLAFPHAGERVGTPPLAWLLFSDESRGSAPIR